jgi:fatty-acyl-CoA synthase
MQGIFKSGEWYEYPLIIKKLLNTSLVYAPDREIVYRDRRRYSYRDLNGRIHRLADGLRRQGVGQGDTVAVFDDDSNRFLECFFAIPMMGAVLQMVNWRLSPGQILYTLNHAEAKIILVNEDFLPLLASIHGKLETVKTVVVMSEEGNVPAGRVPVHGLYEEMLGEASTEYDFPDLDENTKATTFYTTGTTGDPKGVHFSHRQLVLHTLSTALAVGSYDPVGLFRSADVLCQLRPCSTFMPGACLTWPPCWGPSRYIRAGTSPRGCSSSLLPSA